MQQESSAPTQAEAGEGEPSAITAATVGVCFHGVDGYAVFRALRLQWRQNGEVKDGCTYGEVHTEDFIRVSAQNATAHACYYVSACVPKGRVPECACPNATCAWAQPPAKRSKNSKTSAYALSRTDLNPNSRMT